MFGKCDECAYCRLVETKDGREFHVCARHAPIQRIDRSHEQSSFPIVQVYGTNDCINGCGEFHPDYEAIKQKAMRDLQIERDKMAKEALAFASNKRAESEIEGNKIIANARNLAIEKGQTAIHDEVERIVNKVVMCLSNSGTKLKIKNIIEKSLETGRSIPYEIPSDFDKSIVRAFTLFGWHLALITAESKGLKIKQHPKNENEFFRLKAFKRDLIHERHSS